MNRTCLRFAVHAQVVNGRGTMHGAPTPNGLPPLLGIHRTLRAAAVTTVLLLVVYVLRDVLLLAFAAILIACVLRRASVFVGRTIHIGPRWGLLPVVLALVALLGTLFWWRGADVATEAANLAMQVRDQVERLWQVTQGNSWASALIEPVRKATTSIMGGIGGYLTGFASSTLGISGSLLLVTATALFLAISPEQYRAGMLRLLPIPWRDRGDTILGELGRTLQLWFLGQLVDMAAVTLLIGAGLYALDVPLALTLALFAGLLNFIPFIGALVGAVPAVLLALAQSPQQAALVAGLFLAVQMLEGNVLAPIIQRRTVALPPALTIFSQTILGTLFGPLGLILATPVMAAALVLVRMGYVESMLERPTPLDSRRAAGHGAATGPAPS